MARKTNKTNENLLKFLEVQTTIRNSFGAKNGKELDEKSDSFKNHQTRILKGVGLLAEFLGKNPSEIVEYGREAMQKTEKLSNAISDMAKFINWLEIKKGYAPGSAKTIRGNALSIFKWHGIKIPTKNPNKRSEKEKRAQKAGLGDNYDKLKIIREMYKDGDREMKAYLQIGLAGGHRISDNVKLELEIIKTLLNLNQDYVIYEDEDEKQSALIRLVLGIEQQESLKRYIETIDDNRKYLFGDHQRTIKRIREKFVNLLHSVWKGDSNIITPHTLRSVCETVIIDHGFERFQAYNFTGHKGDTYIKLTFKQMYRIFKVIQEDISMEGISFSNETIKVVKNEFNEFLKRMDEIVKNEGKTESLTHLYHEMNDDEKENLDEKRSEEMQMAVFVSNLKESLYIDLLARIKKDLNI